VPSPPPGPPPTGVVTLYFSDCQSGAAAGCVPGDNANPGTQAAPKRDLTGINLSAVSGGSSLLFARGGAWNFSVPGLVNPNTSAAAPLTFADYGSGALPLMRVNGSNGIEFGRWGDTTQDGGYVVRNLVFDGGGADGRQGIFLREEVRDVLIEGSTFRNFEIGIHSQPVNRGVLNLTIRNSYIHNNTDHGMLGAGTNFVFENNRVENNNPSGGGFEHGTYFSAGQTVGSARIVGNIYRNNSAPNGRCDGGNLTMHGMWDGVLVEGNRIEQISAGGGCYGVSITAGYSTAEYFRNVVVRNNTVINVGNCALCLSAAPGALIEGNRLFNSQSTYQAGVLIPAITPGAGDAADTGAVIRNNVVCQSEPASGSTVAQAPSAASIIGNVYQTGLAATTGACAR
jgi:hypothetical protein